MIIFINGSINSGKSTVSEILAKELPNVALIEIDVLREMINCMPLEKAIPINLDNAISLIENFSGKGMDVIVVYPLSQKNYDYVMGKIKDLNEKICCFTLSPKLEKALSNRGTRDLNEWEVERIKHHYDIGIHTPAFGEIIDNSEQSPEETAGVILNKIKG